MTSGRIIGAKDHAAVQINNADVSCVIFLTVGVVCCKLPYGSYSQVDEKTGRMTGAYKTYAICGYIRSSVSPSDIAMLGGATAHGYTYRIVLYHACAYDEKPQYESTLHIE